VEVVEAVGVTDGVDVEESDPHAEGVYALELVAEYEYKGVDEPNKLGDTVRVVCILGINDATGLAVEIPASATWAAATLCATAESDEIVPAA
jgi:hypothetical protein